MVDGVTGLVSSVVNVGNADGKYNGEGVSAPDAWVDRPHFILFTPSDDLLIVERESHRIRVWNRTTNTVSSVFNRDGTYGHRERLLTNLAIDAYAKNPMQVANAANGFIFVDEDNYVLRQVKRDGTVAVIAGTGVSGYAGDGGSALLANMMPQRLVTDADSNLYILDQGRVRKLTCNP
jgi:hypothetical protein